MSLLNNDNILYVLVNATFFFLTTYHRIIPKRVATSIAHTHYYNEGVTNWKRRLLIKHYTKHK